MPFEIPDNWEWCKLGDIVDFQGGYAYKSNTYVNQSDWQVIRIGNVKNDNLVLDTQPVFVEEVIGRETKKYLLQKDDILFTMTGTKGKRDYFYSVKVPSVQKKLLLNQRVGCLRRFSSEVNIDFLCFALKGGYVLDAIFSTETGNVSQGNIGSENTLNLNIAIPPLAEQRRIVSEIERWFSLIDIMENGKQDLQTTIKQAKNKILDLAIHGKLVLQDPNDEPASELLKRINPKAEITCDNAHYTQLPFEVPQNWSWTTLGKIGKWQSGSTPNRLNKDYYNGNIPWLKTGDLNDGYITHIPEYITEKALNETSVKLNPTGSVLIAMYGATIGKIGILTFPATTNQACCACEVFKGIDREFIFLFLLSHREEFIKMGGGGAQPNISKEKIINTYIPLPPFTEQQRIINAVNKIFAQLDTIMESL